MSPRVVDDASGRQIECSLRRSSVLKSTQHAKRLGGYPNGAGVRGGGIVYGSVLFFFFQAEDGIRDLTVTGVQTCALPIYPALRDARGGLTPGCEGPAGRPPSDRPARLLAPDPQSRDHGLVSLLIIPAEIRSEEGLVGKKGRLRWLPHHYKKKKVDTLHELL